MWLGYEGEVLVWSGDKKEPGQEKEHGNYLHSPAALSWLAGSWLNNLVALYPLRLRRPVRRCNFFSGESTLLPCEVSSIESSSEELAS